MYEALRYSCMRPSAVRGLKLPMYEALRSWQEQEYESLNTSNILLSLQERSKKLANSKNKKAFTSRDGVCPPPVAAPANNNTKTALFIDKRSLQDPCPTDS